jgi:hypothetical protein
MPVSDEGSDSRHERGNKDLIVKQKKNLIDHVRNFDYLMLLNYDRESSITRLELHTLIER